MAWTPAELRRVLAVFGPDLTAEEWAARSGWPADLIAAMLAHPGALWRQMRLARWWSQAGVAVEAGLHPLSLTAIERSRSRGRPATVWALHDVLEAA